MSGEEWLFANQVHIYFGVLAIIIGGAVVAHATGLKRVNEDDEFLYYAVIVLFTIFWPVMAVIALIAAPFIALFYFTKFTIRHRVRRKRDY